MKTYYDFGKDEVPFVQVANSVLSDKTLSAKAKGVYAYLYSKPNSWQFSAQRISNDMSDGLDSIETAIQELEKRGLLMRKRQPNGRVIYWVTFPPNNFQNPQVENPLLVREPQVEKPIKGKTHKGKIHLVSNKEDTSNKEEESNKDQVNFFISLFKEINPSYKLFFPRKVEREASERLIALHGAEKLEQAVAVLKQTNGQPYMPTITSPRQLEEKWSQLAAAIKRHNRSKTEVLW